ncbi:MAG TPA: ABC transporter substrate-binding protein, partial [Anaerolineae bacterium]
MLNKRRILFLVMLAAFALIIVACQPASGEVIEVTRVIENTVVETRVVEVEGEEVVVEVTRVVEVEPTAPPIPQGGNVVESSFADANTLNPVLGNDQASSDVYGQMYLGLTTLEEFTGRIIGSVAESWDISDDGLVYTFHLRDDISWTDGMPLTAHDVVF